MIAQEAQQVADGVWPAEDNPLVGAPHTAASIADADWTHPYSREIAVYPGVWASRAIDQDPAYHSDAQERIATKYWPPVRRIDQAYGDRHLVCTCPPPDAFAE
jgi:glycine dehydrogenase